MENKGSYPRAGEAIDSIALAQPDAPSGKNWRVTLSVPPAVDLQMDCIQCQQGTRQRAQFLCNWIDSSLACPEESTSMRGGELFVDFQ